jgi:hypothetical protein
MKSRHTAVVVVRLRMSQTSHYASSAPGASAIPRVLTQSGSGARFQSRFNSAGRHKRHLRGGSFHRVRQLPRARAQGRVPDSMERSRGWAHDRR